MARIAPTWVSRTILLGIAAAVVVVALLDDEPTGAASPESRTAPRSQPAATATKPDPRPSSRVLTPEPASSESAASSKHDADDERDRDAAGKRIAEAIARRNAGASTPTPPDRSNIPEPERPLPGLGKEYIRDLIKDDFVPLAKECYENALERDPELGGRMIFEFTIMGDESVGGIVDGATLTEDSDFSDPDTVECVRESLMSVIFEPPEGGGTVQVTYPFVFESSDGRSG